MSKGKKKKDMTFAQSIVAFDPEINVISKDVMDSRISSVFDQIASTLQKSLGPVGAHAIISQPPGYHVTKDGFTIMKNIRYNSQYGYVDQVISGMIADICGRLNFAVGDGTTSAVVSANAMYQEFKKNSDKINKLFFLPRNVLNRTKELVEDVNNRLSLYATDIKNLPLEEMCEYIRQVVYVSSNADKELTDIIVDLYRQIGYPAISVVKAADGVTKGRVVDGFMFHAKLMDRIYVNNDNQSLHAQKCDVVIFDHKVSLNSYKYILAPLSVLCKMRGRKLICIAPNYDEVTLQGDILNDLNSEYRQTKDINLVIMGYRNSRNSDKKRVSDLAMLCNTQLITQSIEYEIIKRTKDLVDTKSDVSNLLQYINLDNRKIEGNMIMAKNPNSHAQVPYVLKNADAGEIGVVPLDEEFSFRIGYPGEVMLHYDKESIFRDFDYDESLYEKYVNDAKVELDAVIEKYSKLGTFNFEVDDAQKRYLSLKLKMGQIEVGASTDFKQQFLVDAMDDAVKAALSAYRNGVINGGHTTLLNAIRDEIDCPERSDADKFLLEVMFKAFRHVRFCVLENGFSNKKIDLSNIIAKENLYTSGEDVMGDILGCISENIGVRVIFQEDISYIDDFMSYLKVTYRDNPETDLFTLINEIELYSGTTLDLDMSESTVPTIAFNRRVINSAATDREILIASSDLVSLLTTGNQLVITRGNY